MLVISDSCISVIWLSFLARMCGQRIDTFGRASDALHFSSLSCLARSGSIWNLFWPLVARSKRFWGSLQTTLVYFKCGCPRIPLVFSTGSNVSPYTARRIPL